VTVESETVPGAIRVDVALGERSYPVLVGRGVRTGFADLMPDGARGVMVVGSGVPDSLVPEPGPRVIDVVRMPDDEGHKTLAAVEELCETMSRLSMTRRDVVVSVGGGLVSDLAGFAAAVYHRGIAVMHLPTTLLAMVDAAIGGKTGANLPTGKNLVGAFWQPVAVLCDTEALETLPEREMRCGLGEMVKYEFITGRPLPEGPIEERIAECVRIKADIVASDEREGGRRALLNYGHTLGHALEIETDFALAHGEAVAIGLLMAAHVAHRLGRIDDERVEFHHDMVGLRYGLRCTPPEGVGIDSLLSVMARDKKSSGALTFVLDGPRGLETVHDVPEDAVRAAYADLCLRYGVAP
jgi:5-deoxy-5-amino-3-dehydroquinate synthase